jgi:uncharacterized protein YgiM (DUF1202 family)
MEIGMTRLFWASAAMVGLLAFSGAQPASAASAALSGLRASSPDMVIQVQAGSATVRVKSANLRSDASAKSTRVAKLARGTKLEVLDTKGGWLHVKAGEYTGYISNKLVNR